MFVDVLCKFVATGMLIFNEFFRFFHLLVDPQWKPVEPSKNYDDDRTEEERGRIIKRVYVCNVMPDSSAVVCVVTSVW